MATIFIDVQRATRPGYTPGNPEGTIDNGYLHPEDAEFAGLNSGDVLEYRDGTYLSPTGVDGDSVYDLSTSGVPGSPITHRAHAANTGDVIFDGTRNASGRGLRMIGKEYVIFENIKIKDCIREGISLEGTSNNNTFKRITLTGCGKTTSKAGFKITGTANNNVFEECIGEDNWLGFQCRGPDGNDDDAWAIHFVNPVNQPRFNTFRRCIARLNTIDPPGNSDGFQCLSSSDNTFEDCMSHDNGDDGFDCTRGSHRNIFTRCKSWNHTTVGGNQQGFKTGVWGQADNPGVPAEAQALGGGIDCVLTDCVAWNNKNGYANDGKRGQAINCTFTKNSMWGIEYAEGSSTLNGEATTKNCITTGNTEEDIAFNTAAPDPITAADYNFIGDKGGQSVGAYHNFDNGVVIESGHDANSANTTDNGAISFLDDTTPAPVTDFDDPNFGDVPGLHMTSGSPTAVRTGGDPAIATHMGAFAFTSDPPAVGPTNAVTTLSLSSLPMTARSFNGPVIGGSNAGPSHFYRTLLGSR